MITKQDYLNFSGIDLDIELKKSKYDNRSKAVEIFLERIYTWCKNYLLDKYAFDVTADDITAEELESFNRGVLYQIEYELKNGHDSKLAHDTRMMWQRHGFMNITQSDSKRYSSYHRL